MGAFILLAFFWSLAGGFIREKRRLFGRSQSPKLIEENLNRL